MNPLDRVRIYDQVTSGKKIFIFTEHSLKISENSITLDNDKGIITRSYVLDIKETVAQFAYILKRMTTFGLDASECSTFCILGCKLNFQTHKTG